MLNKLLGLDETQEITGAGLDFRGGWLLALVLIAGAIALTVYLYRSESRLSSRRRLMMGICHFAVLFLLILIILGPSLVAKVVKPYQRSMLVLLDTSSSMGINDARTSPEEVGEAARVLGKVPLGGTPSNARVNALSGEVNTQSRLDLARATLGHPEIKLLEKLEENYDVALFTFDSGLLPGAEKEGGSEWIEALEAEGESSQLGSAIDEAVARYSGNPVAGVVVLSDFNWVDGMDPSKAARRLKERGIPIYTVPIGMPAPPDVHVRGVIAPSDVFKGDRVPLRVKIESQGFAGRVAELKMSINGSVAETQQVELGEGIQFAEMMFIPEEESGSVEIAFTATPLSGETTDSNNSASHQVKIIDEKIKVLYIEGMPRWEYRYLRWVLLRDPRLDVTFWMTQGDGELADTSPYHTNRFPKDRESALEYDLIILGDVPSSYFSATQMDLIHELIKERGGSLLMVAGPMAAPVSYRETPIADILPVNIGSGRWSGVGANVYPIVTPEGRESAATSLSLSPDISDRIWANVRPIHALPDLGGAKKGASVLLTLPKAADGLPDYPLVAWQSYGTGKSLFVATEDLWRMRLEVGDRYHARFWGQTIQFLTLSRLLGQNKQITVETALPTYSSGDQIMLFATVLTESFEPVSLDGYSVFVERKGDPDSAAEIELTPVVGKPGFFSGATTAYEDGVYVLRTGDGDSEISNQTEFTVKTIPVEARETGARPELAAQLASLSGGKPFAMSTLGQLPGELGVQGELTSLSRVETELWDAPLFFLLIVLFAGAEWYLRRKENLV